MYLELQQRLTLALEKLTSCHVHTSTKVTSLAEKSTGWQVSYQDATNQRHQIHVDYLVNAGGYRTGTIDDFAHIPRQRMVEFKAACVTHWSQCDVQWPEVIFHGERGTPNGNGTVNTLSDGFFQLHGMTQDITLFKNGLVASNANSAQPQLDSSFKAKLQQHWSQQEIDQRTQRAINHMAQFVNKFDQATVEVENPYLVLNKFQEMIQPYVQLMCLILINAMHDLRLLKLHLHYP